MNQSYQQLDKKNTDSSNQKKTLNVTKYIYLSTILGYLNF